MSDVIFYSSRKINNGFAISAFIIFILIVLSLISVSTTGQLMLVLAFYAQLIILLAVTWRLSIIERGLPIYNIGFVLLSITVLYSAYPLFSFWMSGFEWTGVSDNRMRSYNTSPIEVATFSMYHLLYILSTALGFMLLVRSHKVQYKINITKKGYVHSLVFVYVLVEAWFLLINFSGVQSNYIVMQFSNNLSAIRLISTLGLLYVATTRWAMPFWRNSCKLFLVYQLMLMLLQLSGRTYFFLLMIAFIMLFHKNVRQLSFVFSGFLVFIMLFFFILWGYVKTNLILSMSEFSIWSGSNEFTSLFGTAYDLYYRSYELDSLPLVPWSVVYNDIALLIPSQFFDDIKWSTSQWYLEVIGLRGTGVGMMFGVISQAVVGFGYVEIILRGLFIGLFFGVIQRWYSNNSENIQSNIVYLFFAIKGYYAYRAGTGYIVYFAVYQLIPGLILIEITRKVFFGSVIQASKK